MGIAVNLSNENQLDGLRCSLGRRLNRSPLPPKPIAVNLREIREGMPKSCGDGRRSRHSPGRSRSHSHRPSHSLFWKVLLFAMCL